MRGSVVLLAAFLAACGGGSSTSPVNTSAPAIATECKLQQYDSSYPESFLGSYKIPTPTQKFDPSMIRSVGLKDYFPNHNNGCETVQQHVRLMYGYTFDRLKSIGVDTVEVYPVGRVTDFSAKEWVVEEKNWHISKADLALVVDEAHKRNLKVTLIWQFYAVDMKENWINTTNPTEAEAIKFLNGWHDIMLDLAKFSATYNVENLNIQWSAFSYPTHLYPETATQKFLSIISDIRQVYRGKLFMGWPRFYDHRIVEKVDAIVIPISPANWTVNDDMNISVGLLKERYLSSIYGRYSDFTAYTTVDTKTVPIIWDLNIQSRDSISVGWVEDGFCTNPTSNGAPVSFDDPLCIQKNYVTDFSVQALAIEGAFQAIKEQAYFKNHGVVLSTSYWHSDTLRPSPEGFPNLSQSIRGKPAEKIVKQWFSKI